MPSKKTSKRIGFEEFKRRADSPFETAQSGQDFMAELERRVWRRNLSALQAQTIICKACDKVLWNGLNIHEAGIFAAWERAWIAKIAKKYNDREIRRVLAGKRGR